MGIIVSRFRKKQTTEEILDGIDKRVTELQKFRWRNQQLKKQYIGSLILYSIVIYILAALVFFFYYLPDTWKDRVIYSTPLLIFPVIVWLLKKFLHWYFVKRIAQNDIELEEIRSKKKQILEEVMEKETYKKAKEILEKYDPDRFKKKTVIVTKPVITPASSGLRQRSVGFRGPSPQSGRGRGMSPAATPRLPQGRGSPMQPRQIMSAGRNGKPVMSPYNQPPGPPLPRPVLPRERGKMDKLVEYFVGDGPQNRYALICRYCHSHNGMALKEEFEYLTFRCCYCYQLNPARKQRPYAPKIDFTSPAPSGSPFPKGPFQQSTPKPTPTGSKPVRSGAADLTKGEEDGGYDGESDEDESESGEDDNTEDEKESKERLDAIEDGGQLPPPGTGKQEVEGPASEITNGVPAPPSEQHTKTVAASKPDIHVNGQDIETEESCPDHTNGQSNVSSLMQEMRIS
ncbi:endoplasmic reticulum junction formation protein lunapark-B-like isoform X2 [Liolophura sinensis]|uniref:endoplasmic reticulum junction formation protein lunapark-B-like isoform X2 n=1 Tax=Liolophura sinensis TaxID=3198878 RepID=UPI0031596994